MASAFWFREAENVEQGSRKGLKSNWHWDPPGSPTKSRKEQKTWPFANRWLLQTCCQASVRAHTQHSAAAVPRLTRHLWIEDGSLRMQKGSQTCSPAREPFPSKPLWTLGAPKTAGSPPIDSFVIKQTKMWAGIRKLELPYRDSVATSPPISFQSCLAIFKSNTRLSLALESQSLKEHSVHVSCHRVMLHSQLTASPQAEILFNFRKKINRRRRSVLRSRYGWEGVCKFNKPQLCWNGAHG